MNIVNILNKLKEKHLILDTEESLNLFSECFNKFGISLLLLRDENKFNQILDILEENNIPLQKENGMFALRIFAVDAYDLKNSIDEYFAINEINFLRKHPEILAEVQTVHKIANNIKICQQKNISYKTEDRYNLELLNQNEIIVEEVDTEDVNDYLRKILKDSTLVDKLENNEENTGEEDFNVALELQKVENKICEEYLLPVDDGWKIVINDKEVNSFQEVKNTISTITKLNLSITFEDAILLVLFYKTHLNVNEVDEIVNTVLNKGGEAE